ncbi:MAG: outer membrane beta-barrel protein [Hyphomonadaceae bacterium]
MRIRPFASLFAASLIALAPAHAAAQTQSSGTRGESVSVRDRDRPEYDAPGRRLGTFNLNASLDLAVTSNDNLFAAPSGAPSDVDDIIYSVAPTVALTSDWSRHASAEGNCSSRVPGTKTFRAKMLTITMSRHWSL